MKLKHISTATLETMVKWAVEKEATSIFVACVNKIQKQSEDRGINPVVVLAYAAFCSNFGKFDSMYNESYCNLFRTLKETDDMICVKRYKTWNDGIKEFLDNLERDIEEKNIVTLEDMVKFIDHGNTVLEYAIEITNTHIEPSTIRISADLDDKEEEIRLLNEKLLEMQDLLERKDDEILDLKRANEDMKEEIRITESFKNTLRDFLK